MNTNLVIKSKCTECSHMVVCQYKEDYIDYQHKVKELDMPKFVSTDIRCTHHMNATPLIKEKEIYGL